MVLKETVFEYLEKKDLKVELKSYKEAKSDDGYFMTGFLTVNGKKAFYCEDGGYGGGLSYTQEDKDAANQLTLALKEYENMLIIEKDKILKKIRNEENKDMEEYLVLKKNGYSFYDYECDVEKFFYSSAEKLLLEKDLKRRLKNGYLVAKEADEDTNVPKTYFTYKKTFSYENVLKHFLKEVIAEKKENVFLLDEKTLKWNKYFIKDVENLINNLTKQNKNEITK